MNRQLKFRVWDKEDKKYVSPSHIAINGNGILLITNSGMYLDFENEHYAHLSEKYVVQQWTGLTDKNGVDIYEGDILERIGSGGFCKIVIYWDDHNCAFISKNSFNLHGKGYPISDHDINISDWTYWVVCGNIFENSELLES